MRLLLIEDDSILVNQLKPTLIKAGYTVDCAQDGLEAEQMGNEGIYDIAVLDLGLPLRNGIDVLTNWRQQHNPLPVLFSLHEMPGMNELMALKPVPMTIWANLFMQKNYWPELTPLSIAANSRHPANWKSIKYYWMKLTSQ